MNICRNQQINNEHGTIIAPNIKKFYVYNRKKELIGGSYG